MVHSAGLGDLATSQRALCGVESAKSPTPPKGPRHALGCFVFTPPCLLWPPHMRKTAKLFDKRAVAIVEIAE